MADFTKNIVGLVALLCFMVGSGLTMVGIFKTTDLSEKYVNDSYIIPSQVLNGLTVMFLLYLTATNDTFTSSYKLLIIFLLVGGMLLEIYLSSYADRKAESIAAYVFIVLNFLIRAFFLIDLAQSEWVKPFTSPVKPVQEAIKQTIVAPVENIVKSVTQEVTKPEPTKSEFKQDVSKDLISKWDKLRDSLKDKPEGLNQDSQKDAWENVVKPARNSGRKDIKEVLKEAVEKLKDKDGNPIPLNVVDTVGGKKRS
jgi:hypothetical protein